MRNQKTGSTNEDKKTGNASAPKRKVLPKKAASEPASRSPSVAPKVLGKTKRRTIRPVDLTPKAVPSPTSSQRYKYDVCLSFAGEDRPFVRRVAGCLKRRGIRYFYDQEEKANLLGKDLIDYLDEIYQHRSRYCAMFISQHYKEKLWTNHERRSALARAFREKRDYLLPVRMDDTEIPGVRTTLGYSDARKETPSQIADTIRDKVRGKPVAGAVVKSSRSKKTPKPISTPTAKVKSFGSSSTRRKLADAG